MAVVYFDASAFVKLLIAEDGSDLAAELWDGCDLAVSSRLGAVEVHAAVAAARRARALSVAADVRVSATWEQLWASVVPVELTPRVEQSAGILARRHGLRGADAIHLASALAVGDADVVMAVWDHRLHAGARAEGLALAPKSLTTS